jgi:hypothetical protein
LIKTKKTINHKPNIKVKEIKSKGRTIKRNKEKIKQKK